MSDFFYRQSSVKIPDGGRIRNNAYVKVKGTGFSLPIGLKGTTDTYNPNGTGRPAPVLKDVSVKLEGTAGSLRRCEVSFICFDKKSFEAAEKALLVPGSDVTVEYGYAGPKTPGGSGSHKFRVYDYSFSITKENYFDCSFKGVGKGGEYEQAELQVAGEFPKKDFITDYDGINSKAKVANLFDYIDWAVQNATGTTNSTAFNVDNGTVGKVPEGGQIGVLIAPEGFEGGIDAGFLRSDRIQYIQLKAIVNMINKHIMSKYKGENFTGLKIVFGSKASKVQTKFKSGKIFSADPFKMLIPYASGPENSYPDEVGGTGASENYVTCDSFSGIQTFNTPTDSDPGKLLICRELLKAIQKSIDDDAIQEKAESVEKNEGGFKVAIFFNKLFGAIRDCTAGAWDFYLDQDEDDIKKNQVKIVCRKAPTDGQITPVSIDPVGGRNGIRELKIEASVPKEMQAKMFGSVPGTQSEAQASKDAVAGTSDSTATKPKSVKELCDDARFQINESKYDASAVSSAKAALKSLVNEFNSLADRVKAGQIKDHNDPAQMPMPLTFSCTMDGVEGWQFGDTVASSYLPSRYNGTGGVGKVVFTVTDYEHKISDNDWTTTINAAARIR